MMNNLYALVNENVTLSREVIVRLSDLLDYMLYECNTEWVPLSNEIKFINNYIELEKIRHDDNFNVKTDFPGNISDIAVDAFDLNALDYLVKPISSGRFLKAMNVLFFEAKSCTKTKGIHPSKS